MWNEEFINKQKHKKMQINYTIFNYYYKLNKKAKATTTTSTARKWKFYNQNPIGNHFVQIKHWEIGCA